MITIGIGAHLADPLSEHMLTGEALATEQVRDQTRMVAFSGEYLEAQDRQFCEAISSGFHDDFLSSLLKASDDPDLAGWSLDQVKQRKWEQGRCDEVTGTTLETTDGGKVTMLTKRNLPLLAAAALFVLWVVRG